MSSSSAPRPSIETTIHYPVPAQLSVDCPDGQHQSVPNKFEVVGELKKVLGQRAGIHGPISCVGSGLLDGGLGVLPLIMPSPFKSGDERAMVVAGQAARSTFAHRSQRTQNRA